MTFTTTTDQLREISLKVILGNQAANGAYPACPTMPDYQYSWFRDGAYIAYALTLDGEAGSAQFNGSMGAQWESAFRFHNWVAARVIERTDRLERAIAAAQRGETPKREAKARAPCEYNCPRSGEGVISMGYSSLVDGSGQLAAGRGPGRSRFRRHARRRASGEASRLIRAGFW